MSTLARLAIATLDTLDSAHVTEDTLATLAESYGPDSRGPDTLPCPSPPSTVRTSYTLAWHVSDDGEVLSVYPVRLAVLP